MSLPTQKFLVPVSGGELAVFQYGDGIGTPVLLIHGVTSSNRAFQLFADSLIARGKAPFAVDLRGRGDSNSLPGPFGMANHAHDMAAVIDHFGWKSPDVIGHSMGAFVTAALVKLKVLAVRFVATKFVIVLSPPNILALDTLVLNTAVPLTSNVAVGAVDPIPTLPPVV